MLCMKLSAMVVELRDHKEKILSFKKTDFSIIRQEFETVQL